MNAGGICYSSGKTKKTWVLGPPSSALMLRSAAKEEAYALGAFVASPVANAIGCCIWRGEVS